MGDYDLYYEHGYADWMDEAAAEVQAELIEEAMAEASAENVRDYLCRYGDAVEERVQTLLSQANELVSGGFCGPATTVAVTASELIIRFLLLRPLVQGAFLDDMWAAVLTDRVVRGRSADDRELLPRVLRGWGIDITTIRLSNGEMLWEALQDTVRTERNNFVHLGEPIGEDSAKAAIYCSVALLEVAYQVGAELQCGPSVTGKWREVALGSGSTQHTRSFEADNPFG